MKVLLINYEYPPLGGGGGIVSAWLAQALAKRHTVTVLTSRAFDLPAREIVSDVEVIRVPTMLRRSYAAATMLSMASYVALARTAGVRLVRRRQFDVVNTHFVVPSGLVGRRVAAAAGAPHIISVHGGDLFDPSKWTSPHRHAPLRGLIRRLLREADAVVAQSRNTADNARNIYVPDLVPELIPLGIPRPAPGEPAERGAYRLTDEDFVLVTVGRLVARKAADQLLTMVARLADRRVKLLVIGDGPEMPKLKSRARALDVEEQVRFLGFVDDETKLGVLKMADAFVSTSQHEGFGLVFIEAMAAGLPVFCYDFGGQSDFLEHERTGYLFELNALDAMTNAVGRALRDRQPLDAMRATVRDRAESLFIDRCAQRYDELFQRLVAERRGVPAAAEKEKAA